MDEAVDLGVEAHLLVARAAGGLVDPGQQPLELLPTGGREALRRAVGGVALELLAHVGDVREVGDVDLGGERPAAREHRDEVLEREPLDRLAHRRAAHVELAAERVLVDRRAGGDAQRDDAVPQRRVGAVGEQLAAVLLTRPRLRAHPISPGPPPG